MLRFIKGKVGGVPHCGILLPPDVSPTPRVFTGFSVFELSDWEDCEEQEAKVKNLDYLNSALERHNKGWRAWKKERGVHAEQVFSNRVLRLDTASDKQTIFVSIPSYRDPEVVSTIRDLWNKADHPERVVVGVCQQINLEKQSKDDVDVRRVFASQLASGQLRVDTMDYRDAQGPCLARERIEKKCFRGEDFYLMIDAHMVFSPGWDTKIINDWYLTGDPKAILTTYPREYQTNRGWTDSQGTFLVGRSWEQNGMPLFVLRPFHDRPDHPVPNMAWVATFSFAPKEVVQRVPYLCNVPFLFIGEEIAMAARYYTHGYSFYAPTFPVVQTTYKHKGKKKFEELDFKRGIRLESERFIRVLLGMSGGDLSKYESSSRLGSERSMKEFETYSGIVVSRRKFTMNALVGLTTDDTAETKKWKWENEDTMNTVKSRKMFQM